MLLVEEFCQVSLKFQVTFKKKSFEFNTKKQSLTAKTDMNCI